MFSDRQRKKLLYIARKSVEYAARGDYFTPEAEEDSELSSHSGAFVTIYKKSGDLRGCIGYIISDVPLYKTIAMVARAAALNDPRFNKLSEDELSDIYLDISVLSIPEEISDIKDIQVGRDGMIISHKSKQGLLLPQVAEKYGWSRENFLEETCRKAGLPALAWQWDDIIIKTFSAEVFGESGNS